MIDNYEECAGQDCPQCRAMAEQCNILGGIAEAMQRMIDDGTFYRLGREAAERREKAFWEAFLAK